MDSERRRLNKLLRKSGASINKSSTSALHKTSKGASKIVKENCSKPEINVDITSLCAEMCGVSNLSPLATTILQKHLNQIARLLIHQILRVMEQSRRGVPQASDVDLATVLIGLESPFGTLTNGFLPIRTGGRTATSGSGNKVFFIRPDKEIDVKALILREPAGVVYDVSLVAHWLAINGLQPVLPQNPSPDFVQNMSALNDNRIFCAQNLSRKLTSSDADAKLVMSKSNSTTNQNNTEIGTNSFNNPSDIHPRKVLALTVERRSHEISQEVMIYFRELTEACVGASENRRHEALENVTLDPSLQPILPHLVTFITEGVRINVMNHNLAILIYLMRLVKALIDNSHISLEPYLHLLIPTVITCVLNRQLCAKPITDNHWALRDFAAKQLVTLCNRHNTSTNELYTRVTGELSRALRNWINGSNEAFASTDVSNSDVKSQSALIGDINLYVTNDTISTSIPTSNATGTATATTNDTLPTTPGIAITTNTITATTTTGSSNGNSSTLPTPCTTSTTGNSNNTSNNSSGNSGISGPSLGSAIHSMNTLYGILISLVEFGSQCLRTIVFPVLPVLCTRLTNLTQISGTGDDSINVSQQSTTAAAMAPTTNTSTVVGSGQSSKLSPVDQRSFEFLKVMLMNRLAPSLLDWRVRQGLGLSLNDYKTAYKSMAVCLFLSQPQQPQQPQQQNSGSVISRASPASSNSMLDQTSSKQ